MTPAPSVTSPVLLGIEGGGTRTTVRLVDGAGTTIKAFHTHPAVLSLMTDRELRWHLRDIASRLPQRPQAIGIGLAGARTAADQERLRRATLRVWPGIPCVATNDLETALAAAPVGKKEIPRVLVLSGTGSCCFGRAPDGRTAKVGGRGHIIGDRGSACDIGLRALRAVMADLDHRGRMGPLGAAILNALMFNDPDQLIPWSVHAPKTEIANLAITVFALAQKKDALAKKILSDSAAMLAEDACACACQLTEDGAPVEFILNGGVMLRNPAFMKDVTRRIRKCWSKARVSPLQGPSVLGAVNLARGVLLNAAPSSTRQTSRVAAQASPALELPASIVDLAVLKDSPTEKRNPRSMTLDRLNVIQGIELMLSEDALIPPAILKEKRAINQVVAQVMLAFENGGRLFYAGAGTSGRLGVLDASEIPPTFRAPREQVQGIIAGGRQALWSAVEGAEDDAQAGATAMTHRQLGPDDVLVGIAASGRTPFVWGAIHEANRRGAFTALLCFNPAMRAAVKKIHDSAWQPQALIIPNVGPEVLTGSTRLKSGTATKLVLNLITTLAMTRTGKVISNLMVDLNPSNVKLRDRALRILVDLTGCTRDAAREALQSTGWQVKDAYLKLK
ncbi:N-acetylmuramic acid 6-phosphate etherase [Prosthecobacter fusiformis]|uniref:N-acetylmuramic acid 6-phosphate etherase n=1 Tax=Prosthecobacter fusiformis TaxID=48464 RepID=A0A4R7RJJ1_9BACT|nr:N-acetylmuramic acid 6-phosphate etherase [Prosthecobacter fusiformis]TDU64327.1 N-acetylmuramic acid 6-phosphate etherase [Prosthecobacter fusiformis]